MPEQVEGRTLHINIAGNVYFAADMHDLRMARKDRSSDAQPRVRRDYLRRLGDDVDAALALIVHDLVSTGAMSRDDAVAAVRIRAQEHFDSSADLGVTVDAAETAVWVTEALQEDLIEGWGESQPMVVWPRCPDHANHPLWLSSSGQVDGDVVLDDPAWTCRATGRTVVELGQL